MSLFVGIDGGGTHTTAVVARADGSVLARVDGGAGRVDVLNPTAGATALAQLTRDALQHTGGETVADSRCCALSGAGREPERTQLEQALREQNVARTVIVVTDFEAAMQDAFGSGPGILAIAGTGSSAWGRSMDGRCVRVGGWGHIIGDEGSGYALGRAALALAMREFDGRGESAGFLKAVLAHTNLATEDGLVRWAASASKGDIAGLARIVFDAAARGSVSAADVIEDAAAEIAMHVAALYDRLGPWDTPPAVALAGG